MKRYARKTKMREQFVLNIRLFLLRTMFLCSEFFTFKCVKTIMHYKPEVSSSKFSRKHVFKRDVKEML